MINEIYNSVIYLLSLTFESEVLWIVIPLIFATFVMLFYLQRYHEELPCWNTHVANSLVLLFVSVMLFRYVYELDFGLISYVNYFDKFIFSSFILFFGFILLFFNFAHILPKKISGYLSSPLFVNSIAYVIILAVYAKMSFSFIFAVALIIILILLGIILSIIRIPLRKFFEIIRKMKEKEEVEDIFEEKKSLKNKEKEINSKRKNISRLNKTLNKKPNKKSKKSYKKIRKL